MASLVVRNLEDGVKERLRVRASGHGRSMEAEVRAILRAAVNEPPPRGETLAELAAELFGPEHGVDLTPYLPRREPMRAPPDFEASPDRSRDP